MIVQGHTVTRKLNSDGRVDAMQTLHNLDEGQFMFLAVIIDSLLLGRSMIELILYCLPGDLAGFEEAWNCNAKGDLPSWKHGLDMHGNAFEIY